MSQAWETGHTALLVMLTALVVISGMAAVGSPVLNRQHPASQAAADATSSGERINSAATNGSSHTSEGGWTMERSNAANTNHINTTGPTNPTTERWTFATDANDFGAGPIVANGTVYFGIQNYRSYNGKLYALDAWTGEKRWTFQSPSGDYPNKIAVLRNTVYVSTPNGKVYALDAASGDTFWKFTTDGRPTDLSVANRTLYVTSKGTSGCCIPDGHVYALGALRGEEKWAFTTDKPARGLAVKDGTVYVTAWSGILYALGAENGAKEWNVRVSDGRIPVPSVANGIVYQPGDGGLHALDAETGEERWTVAGGSPPSVLGNTAYFTANNSLYAVNAQKGTTRWRSRSLKRIPVLTNDIGYVRTNKTLHTLDPATGAHNARWYPEQINNSWDRFRVGMAVFNGSLYTGVGYDDPGNRHRSDRTVFYALGTPEFTYTNLSVTPQSPEINESVTARVTVRNTGTGPGTYNATLAVNGGAINNRVYSLEAGSRSSVTFDLRFPKKGTYTVKLGGLTRTISVGDVSPDTNQTTTLTPVPDTDTRQTGTSNTGQTGTSKTPTDTTSPGLGVGVWVVAVVLGSWLLRYRHWC